MSTRSAQASIPWDTPAPPFRHEDVDDNLARSFEDSLRISKEIDEQLLASKKALEKKKKSVQILLLDFQLAFAPKQFETERFVWKTIVQLNLIGSIKLILEILSHEWESTDAESQNPLTRELRRIRLGLSPLFFIAQNAVQLISPGSENFRDLCVRPGSNWKELLRERLNLPSDDSHRKRRSQTPLNKEIDPTPVLVASKNDILTLWKDANVRAALKKRGVRMEEMPGFFLNDIERIADENYWPTDSDIMRARLRTLGVQEHYFVIEQGLDVGSEVYITDVGGSRNQRPKWIPYFEDVQTILFLAPLTFDRSLEEDPGINRLEDSLLLWREICRNKILAKATLILFFNKTDVLRRTLAAGVKVKKFVPSYGDLPNEVAPVTKYFCDKFRTYHRKLSPIPRPFMFHETSAITINKDSLILIPPSPMSSTKTIVILGAAYGGPKAAQILAAGVPEGWRVLLIDRNSTDVYILPRLSVLPGHEHKACKYYTYIVLKCWLTEIQVISNSNIFLLDDPDLIHRRLQATVTSISKDTVTLSKAFPEHGLPSTTVQYDYMIYALGSHMPTPLNLWATGSTGKVIATTPGKGRQLPIYQGMKSEGISWLKEHQKIVEAAATVLVIGGGALGIQFATDIATVHPTKKVTLLHSRKRLLPRFDEAMHTESERLELLSVEEQPEKLNERGERVVRTLTGREIAADLLLLCTGQTPNTGLLKELDPATVNPGDSLAHVLRTMQLGVLRSSSSASTSELEEVLEKVSLSESDTPTTPSDDELLEETPYPHIFVVGDAADAFGAIAAGHNAYYQGIIAANNILHLIKRSEGASEEDEPLERYQPGPPAIKVSLGIGKAVFQSQGVIGRRDGGPDDLYASSMWPMFGIEITDDDQMYE
ncbi:hypothetical protein DXG01_017018 [Tephrocybe rancida]|nr:hypothetical protein DXG01_017018 [Tephrocybe rancida]